MRTDHEWLEARERGESVDHIDPARRAAYRRLERRIAELPPDGWEARVLEQIEQRDAVAATPPVPPPRRRTRRAVWIGALAAAAVVLVIVWARRPPPSGSALAIETFPTASTGRKYMSGPSGSREAMASDTLQVRRALPITEVRAYWRDGRLRASCAGDAYCRATGTLDIVLDETGTLEILGFAGCAMPAPGATRDADEKAAHEQGCEIPIRELVKVQ